MDRSTTVRVSVLGPLRATVGGAPADLRGPRQRAVLAALLAARPGPVGIDRLLDDVWADATLPGLGTLQYYVSALRTALEPGRARDVAPAVVVRRGQAYELVLGAEAVDADRFGRLAADGAAALAAGRPPDAVRLLDEALGLWAGEPYADLGDAAFLAPERARLTELRLGAVEDVVAARLAAGSVAEAVAEAQRHTARHPLRERGWELLVTGLYRAGRQSEALAALRTVRGVLAEELGLDPGPGLVAVEAAVLAHDPALGAGPPPAQGGEMRVGAGVRTAPAPPADGLPPLPLTAILGRDALVDAVGADLAGARLVTVTGPGGVGKTRVAVELAHRTAGEVRFVELGPVADPALVPAAVAAACGIPGAAAAAAVAGVLGPRALLLVLDNAEHLVDAVVELVSVLLARCRGLRVLVTSRTALDLPGEVVREVPPLDPAGSAAELFARRARAAVPGWEPDADERAAVVRICAELDGLPLAIELAAARMRVLSAAELADALAAGPLDVLDGAAPPRGRWGGLETAVHWSYAALPEVEQRLFRRLAVFADGFDVTGAAAVGGGGRPVAGTLPPLAGLVRRSVLATVPGPGPRRFRMLRTVRDFARRQGDDAERADAAAAHRRHVLRQARAAEAEIRARGRRASSRRCAATGPSSARRSPPPSRRATGLGLVAALGWSWYRDGAIAEGLRAVESALAVPTVPTGGAPGTLSRVLHQAGSLHYLAGDAVAAQEALSRAAALARDATAAAHSSAWLAHVRTFTGPPADALALAESTAAAAAGGVGWVHAEALMIAGMVARRAGSRSARATLARAVDVAERAGHGWAAVSSTWALMKAAVDDGDHDAALAAAARMRGPLAADGDVTSWLVLVHTTAGALAGVRRGAEAALLMGAVAALGERVGFVPARMDPVDGAREAAAVRSALAPGDYADLAARGRALDRAEVDGLLAELLG